MYFCNMHTQLSNFIKEEKLITKADKVLLAVSGGLDSIVMSHLFAQLDFPLGIAHCNFCLRGEESDRDADFVEAFAKKMGIPFHHKICNTKEFASDNKISIQMAARELRFSWFEKLCDDEGYTVYATAHHSDDAIETYFINQIRGTGISGMHGIKTKNKRLIHPLLFTNRIEIDNYAKQKSIDFREDSSNSSTKYMRNSLRHNLIPILADIQPSYKSIFMQNMKRFEAVEKIYLHKIGEEKNRICREEEGRIHISASGLIKLEESSTYLYEIIKDYGFSYSQAEEIIKSITEGHAGAKFYAAGNILLRDREDLIVSKNIEHKQSIIELDHKTGKIQWPIHLQWESSKDIQIVNDPKVAMLDLDKLVFPLKVRLWEEGDTFSPLGMKGKKLLSDFFIDLKMNQFEKESTYLLISGNKVVWVIGHRIDHRFRITDKTRSVLKIVNQV